MDRAATAERIGALIAPFNKKEIAITDATTFSGDLEFDSLTVMDFVAEIETYGQLVDAVVKLQG
jgi:acyl carrier protein